MPYVSIYTAISPDDRYADRTSRDQGPYQWKLFALKIFLGLVIRFSNKYLQRGK